MPFLVLGPDGTEGCYKPFALLEHSRDRAERWPQFHRAPCPSLVIQISWNNLSAAPAPWRGASRP